MAIRDEIINFIVERCENEIEYYDVVNERNEEIDYQLITEFIFECMNSVLNEQE